MMAKQAQFLFLEEWLRSNNDGSPDINSRQSSSPSARAIIQAWTDLRDALQQQSFHRHHLESLKTLLSSQISLYVADPQAKLIVSILGLPNLSLPCEAYPQLLRLLYIWVRKSAKPSSMLIDSAVGAVSDLFAYKFEFNRSSLFISEGVLLLGAFAFVPSTSEKSRSICLELLSKLLEEEYTLICSSDEGLVPRVLAGIGYALSSLGNVPFVRILNSLFGIWDKEDGPSGSISNGLMMLHLIEWVLSNFISSHSSEKVSFFAREVLETSKPIYAPFAVVMAAAGAMRASAKSVSSGLMQLRISAEERIDLIARELVSRTGDFTSSVIEPRDRLLLQCISLTLARSGSVSSRASLLICLSSALLTEIFPLRRFYTGILGYHRGNLVGLTEVKEHLVCTIFKEAGAITGAFCNQYVLADEGSKSRVENLIWDYCQDVYLWHRQVALLLWGVDDELIRDLEKVAESAFLMVVVFALAVTKQRLDSRVPRETQLEISVRILVSFSCLEYFRRMRLSEYMDTIRGVVVSVQENESACTSFVESMPSYDDLTNQHGSSSLLKMEYMWSKDEVQTARILFYLRVIPTCVERMSTSVFRKVVAPTMFLYMGHPNGKVARASHSMFVAFLSSGKDSNQEERDLLKEQLVFYYIQRSLEGYPGVTPFDGMASGVAALVRHLPAGSPSIFYCIHCLAEKANSFCGEAMNLEADLWKNWQGELEPCKKLLELLLRLLSLVDIQVLPSLMKLLAQLIVQLPKDGQNMVLNDLYEQIADSDDVTRKPALVSWLQSLSYLCSQNSSRNAPKGTEHDLGAASSGKMGTLSLNRVHARL
ncbi:hypothetical protein RJ639_016879 [Escallonia herrerae]|uniref:Uncharacterized protein n=1 Tax=Escallonia herrerae TaxID=1293975 RepID=A0AA89ALL5_9ASTE|nr:hypothetical protein RJ639_016879 [Escallonia herrerae]